MKKSLFIAAGFAMITLFLLGGAGCGKKGDPRPPRAALPAAVAGLSAAPVPEGIALAWSLTGPAESVGSFRILRSRPESGGEACPGCPKEYLPPATLNIGDRRLERVGERGFRYLDPEGTKDRSSFYRVSVCDRRGNCGEWSEEVGVLRGTR
jgi:hypothetical protein